ncbi:ABC-type transporter, integral membrane subunit [Thalassoporum mexicanum PCC 7367]|uniref:metal ABC transporter permease n=1 Tax=Thalassoporum mexicanum TaxID=3457544 RepID=UPI00029FC979|nr:metal ABC transporter permease [Pseudanabaena sp. PCC 7367]AFY71595.1 ABC-type transporter, integral membrane subunit [Pseudanabaena sp. PCC 7367]
MSITTELTRVFELYQQPFMQRAVLGGMLTGLTGGLLGSFTILRQLSFFSDALGHSALLGISLGIVWGVSPTLVLLPFAVIFAIAINYLLERTNLRTDALLNIVYSSSLALAIIILSYVKQYKGGLHSLLFGDILAIQEADLLFSGVLLAACIIFLGLTFRTQMLITLNEPMAIARGVSVSAHRNVFTVMLALLVAISVKAIGVLLVSAFVVIPASAARLLSRSFVHYAGLSTLLGATSALLGMFISALLRWPSGPSIVITQLGIFLSAIAFSHWRGQPSTN